MPGLQQKVASNTMETLVKETPLVHAFADMDPKTLPMTDFIPDSVVLMRREMSLITERLLMAAGCPQGSWPGARDYVLETVAVAGVEAFDVFEEALIARDAQTEWNRARLTNDDTLDCAGEPMILVGEITINAALAYFTDHSADEFLVTGLSTVDGHEGLQVRGRYHGFALTVQPNADEGTLRITAERCEADDQSDLVQLLKHGVTVSGSQWWRLYQPSNYALSVDTDQSRLHTGVSETFLHYTV